MTEKVLFDIRTIQSLIRMIGADFPIHGPLQIVRSEPCSSKSVILHILIPVDEGHFLVDVREWEETACGLAPTHTAFTDGTVADYARYCQPNPSPHLFHDYKNGLEIVPQNTEDVGCIAMNTLPGEEDER